MGIDARLRSLLTSDAYVRSAAELARRARLNPVTVRAYVSGERNPPLDICDDLGRVFGVRGRWVFEGKEPKYLSEQAKAVATGEIIYVPILDYVTAGKLAEPTSSIPMSDVPTIAFADLGVGEHFALQVHGTSMDRISPDGSIVVVNRRDKALIGGKCYIFSYKGATTYKLWANGDPAYLAPYSTDAGHRPIFIQAKRDLEVIGRVKRTILDL